MRVAAYAVDPETGQETVWFLEVADEPFSTKTVRWPMVYAQADAAKASRDRHRWVYEAKLPGDR